MEYVISQSQRDRINKIASFYLNSFDWVEQDLPYNEMTRLFIKGQEDDPENTMFEAYTEPEDGEDNPEFRMLLVDEKLRSIVMKTFNISHNEINHFFLNWYNQYTGEKCTEIDYMHV